MDSSRSTSTQTIVNNADNTTEENKAEVANIDSYIDSDRDSVHSNWSEANDSKERNEHRCIHIYCFLRRSYKNKCPGEKEGSKEYCISAL